MKRSEFLKGRVPGLDSLGFHYGLLVLVLLNPNPLASASPDPLDQWQVRVPASDGLLGCEYRSVAYGDGQWVIVGNAGAIDLNLGGGTCVSRLSGTSASLSAVTFADGMFVSVGERGTILSSIDTLTWTPHGETGLGDLCGVTFGGGIHVAVGQRGIILISPDLQDWQLVPSGTTNTLRSIAFGDGGFVAVGDLGVSRGQIRFLLAAAQRLIDALPAT